MTANWLRLRIASLALAGVATLVGGCAWDTPMSTVVARSDFARDIVHVYAIITWVSIGIGVVVFSVLVYVLVRFRDRPGAALPPQTRGHTLLEVSWTIAPALVLLIIAIPTVRVVFRTQAAPPADALQVTVRAWQWWWEFRYPGLDVVTANELVLPAGQPVTFRLEGPDVIHSFWFPRLGGKRDVIPGRINFITLTPDGPDEFVGQCVEFCGVGHANMRLTASVLEPASFEAWVAAQRAPAAEPTGLAAEGRDIYARSACVGCHTIQGVSAGVIAPDLTHFGSRRTLAAGMYPNTAEHLTAWLLDPPRLKPGVKMPPVGLTPGDAAAVAAYLLSLK